MHLKAVKILLIIFSSYMLLAGLTQAQDLGAPLELDRRQAKAEMTVTSTDRYKWLRLKPTY